MPGAGWDELVDSRIHCIWVGGWVKINCWVGEDQSVDKGLNSKKWLSSRLVVQSVLG